jgi:site-specific recombinase XerD
MEVIAQVNDIRPYRFRHEFGTNITRRGVDLMYGKELMGIKSDRVYGRTCSRSAETMVFHYAPVRTAFTFILMYPKLQN